MKNNTTTTTTFAPVPASAISSAKAVALATFKDISTKVTLNSSKSLNVTMSRLLVSQVAHDLALSEKEEAIKTLRASVRKAEKELSAVRIRYREVSGAIIARYTRTHARASQEQAQVYARECIGTQAEYCKPYAEAYALAQETLSKALDSIKAWKLSHPSPCDRITTSLKAVVKEAGAKSARDIRDEAKAYVMSEYKTSLNAESLTYLIPTVDKGIAGTRALKAGAPVREAVEVSGFGNRLLNLAIRAGCTSSKWVEVAQRLTAQKN